MMTKEQLAKAVAAKKADPGMGRPKLQRLTGCSRGDALKFLAKYGAGSKFGNKVKTPGKTPTASCSPKSAVADIEGGIYLHPATRVLGRKPPVTVRSKFFSLPKGKAFTLAVLAKRWGFSVETIKRHAKDEDCFAYVDVTNHDDFEECAMHPETAAARLKG